MNTPTPEMLLASLPKAELHLHVEGAIEPATAVQLAARHGLALSEDEVAARYQFSDFAGFLEAYKWVTSLLRSPGDYALIAERLAERLLAQNVRYAEVTLSVGVMLRRKQDIEANLAAMHQASEGARARGLRLAWIFDAVRQFGPAAAEEVAQIAARLRSEGVVAFGLGGDELAVPAREFGRIYDYVAAEGLHRVAHAGEVGGPEAVRDALEWLGAERIGHGIAAMHDPHLLETLREQGRALELCPTSNLKTGALARQLNNARAGIEDHPVRRFFDSGVPLAVSTDDPAMFATSLNAEYALLLRLGFTVKELATLSRRALEFSFLAVKEKHRLLAEFNREFARLALV